MSSEDQLTIVRRLMVPVTETNELHGCSATATALYDRGFSHLM